MFQELQMMRRRFLAAALFIGVAVTASAESVAPDSLVRSVTDEVLQIVRSDKELQAGNARRARELVTAKVLPHFNFTRMTALAVGRDWRQANPGQQKALVDEFRTLLVRTYSNALTAYRNQTVDYKPLRMNASDSDVTVHTQINQPGGRPVTIDYALEKNADSWKVYDVTVGGVSLVTNYRDSFGAEIRNGGIDGLIKLLHAKNQGSDDVTGAEKR